MNVIKASASRFIGSKRSNSERLTKPPFSSASITSPETSDSLSPYRRRRVSSWSEMRLEADFSQRETKEEQVGGCGLTVGSTEIVSGLQVPASQLAVIQGKALASKIHAKEVRVTGTFEGTLQAEALHIAAGGVVVGTVIADSAVVAGNCKGLLTISGRLTLCSTGSIIGDVEYGSLKIVKGGKVNGNMRRRAEEEVERGRHLEGRSGHGGLTFNAPSPSPPPMELSRLGSDVASVTLAVTDGDVLVGSPGADGSCHSGSGSPGMPPELHKLGAKPAPPEHSSSFPSGEVDCGEEQVCLKAHDVPEPPAPSTVSQSPACVIPVTSTTVPAVVNEERVHYDGAVSPPRPRFSDQSGVHGGVLLISPLSCTHPAHYDEADVAAPHAHRHSDHDGETGSVSSRGGESESGSTEQRNRRRNEAELQWENAARMAAEEARTRFIKAERWRLAGHSPECSPTCRSCGGGGGEAGAAIAQSGTRHEKAAQQHAEEQREKQRQQESEVEHLHSRIRELSLPASSDGDKLSKDEGKVTMAADGTDTQSPDQGKRRSSLDSERGEKLTGRVGAEVKRLEESRRQSLSGQRSDSFDNSHVRKGSAGAGFAKGKLVEEVEDPAEASRRKMVKDDTATREAAKREEAWRLASAAKKAEKESHRQSLMMAQGNLFSQSKRRISLEPDFLSFDDLEDEEVQEEHKEEERFVGVEEPHGHACVEGRCDPADVAVDVVPMVSTTQECAERFGAPLQDEAGDEDGDVHNKVLDGGDDGPANDGREATEAVLPPEVESRVSFHRPESIIVAADTGTDGHGQGEGLQAPFLSPPPSRVTDDDDDEDFWAKYGVIDDSILDDDEPIPV